MTLKKASLLILSMATCLSTINAHAMWEQDDEEVSSSNSSHHQEPTNDGGAQVEDEAFPSFQFHLLDLIQGNGADVRGLFHIQPLTGGEARIEELPIRNIQRAGVFLPFPFLGLESLDPLAPSLPEDLGSSKEKIRFTVRYQDDEFPCEGVDTRRSYPHIGEWTYPLAAISQETHKTRAHLTLKIRLEDGRLIPILGEHQEIYKDINHIEGDIIEAQHPIGLHYDGRKAYKIERLAQRWIYPRRLVEMQHLAQNSYTWACIDRSKNIQTHEGSHIIYATPIPLGGPAQRPEVYRGDYGLLVSDNLAQHRRADLDSGLLIYSDGKDLFIPKVTQELWERTGGERVGFGIVSYREANRITLNPSTSIRGNHCWPEGLYHRIYKNDNGQERKEVWKKLRFMGERLDEAEFIHVENNKGYPNLNVIVSLNNASEDFSGPFQHSRLINQLDLDSSYFSSNERENGLLNCLRQWQDLEILKINYFLFRNEILFRNERDSSGSLTRLWQAMPNSLKVIELIGNKTLPSHISSFIDCIGNFRALKKLMLKNVLHCEDLTRMIESLLPLSHLTHIDFEGTSIGGRNATTIAHNLQRFPHLTFLSLKDVGFSVSVSVRAQRNRSLWFLLSDSQRESNSQEEISDFLDTAFAIALGQNLHAVPRLQHLDISQPRFDSPGFNVRGGIEIGLGLRSTPLLESFDLSGNYVGEEGGGAIAGALSALSRLKELKLTGCGLGGGGIRTLGENLRYLTNLCHLSIGSNNSNSESIRIVIEALQPFHHLERLNLRGSNITDELSPSLSRMLSNLTSLQVLDMSQNQIRSNGVRAIAINLRSMPGLRHLDISSNAISNQGIQSIGENLQHVQQLTYLNLSYNQFCNGNTFRNEWGLSSGDGFAILVQGLQFLTSLEYLGLGYNNIGNSGGLELIHNLNYLTHLKSLNLSQNYLEDTTIRELANNFARLPNLEELKLEQNFVGMPEIHLSMETAMAFVNNFQYTPRIRFIYFSYMPQQGAELIRQRRVNVYGGPFD